MNTSEKTTIRIRMLTRDRLLRLASKAETYDDFLNRLMDLYEKGEA